jgi:Mg-chelatase subunit ChlD
MAAAHPQFGAVSPGVGRLDESAFARSLSDDADAAVALLADLAAATDPRLRAEARRIARRMLPPLARVGVPRLNGTRRMVSRRGDLEGDVDMDRTLERGSGARPRDARDLVTRRFAGAPRSVCLLVDRSGSMSGHAVGMAAVAAAAVTFAVDDRLQCSVVAFAAEPLVLRDARAPRGAGAVVDDLLSLRGHGTTDLARALHVAGEQLEHVPAGGRTVLLLSDCLSTVGADPRAAAGLFDALHVLGPSDDPEAVTAGRALARRGGGRFLPATTLDELSRSLQAAL